MGCDIHMYLEGNKDGDGWKNLDYYKKNKYYGKYEDELEYEVVNIYDGRNYTLFSILAGVRNYGGNIPICDPKGIPDDCNDDIKKEYDAWEGDAHSASYLTLKELKDYKATHKFTKFRGMISPKQIEDLEKNNIKPTSWCQWTNQEGYEFREWTMECCEVDPIINKIEERIIDEWYIWLYDTEEERQSKIKEYEDKVRIVFWFDN